jgi:hypothetical protein
MSISLGFFEHKNVVSEIWGNYNLERFLYSECTQAGTLSSTISNNLFVGNEEPSAQDHFTIIIWNYHLFAFDCWLTTSSESITRLLLTPNLRATLSELLKSFSRPNFSADNTFPWDMKATNWQREGEKWHLIDHKFKEKNKIKLDPSGKEVIITAKIPPQIPWSSFRGEWNHREEEEEEEEEEWRGDTTTPCSTRCHGRSQSPTEERRRDPQEPSQWQTWCYRNRSWSAALPMPWLLYSTPSLPSFLMQTNTKLTSNWRFFFFLFFFLQTACLSG